MNTGPEAFRNGPSGDGPSGTALPSEPFVDDTDFKLHVGDVRDVLPVLPAESVDCCVTSPPYWGLRDYGSDGQLGLEASPEAYVAALVAVFADVRRLLTPAGTLWLNLGDSYSHGGNGSRDPAKWPKQSRNDHRVEHAKAAGDTKPKDLVGIAWRVALALQADGWYLRSDIIWSKPNPMPESVTDRPTKSHEYVFLLAKSARYFYDAAAIAEPAKDWSRGGPGIGIQTTEHYGAGNGGNAGLAALAHRYRSGNKERKPNPAAVLGRGDTSHGIPWEDTGNGRNARTVWEVATQPYPDAHFATYPEDLVRRCILAGCPDGGVVLDPFMGSGTTALVDRKHGRRSVGVELNPEYAAMAARRLGQQSLLAAVPTADGNRPLPASASQPVACPGKLVPGSSL